MGGFFMSFFTQTQEITMDHRELVSLYDLGHIKEHSPDLIH